MGFRIDKSWLTTLPISAVKRKNNEEVAATDDRSQRQSQNQYQNEQQQQQEKDEQTSDKLISKENLEKLVEEAKASKSFAGAGLSAEVVETAEGLTVRLTQATGATLKSMSAEEFLKLRQSAHLEESARGNILDQKI